MSVGLNTIIRRGDTSIAEVPGRRVYTDNSGLTVLEIPVLGSETDLSSLPEVGDYHPDYPQLTCTEVPLQWEPGAAVSSRIIYKGGQASGGIILGPGYTEPRRSGGETEKTMSVTGLVQWEHSRARPWPLEPLVLHSGSVETNFSVRYRANSVTYRYGGTSWFSGPKFGTLAAVDVSDSPQILSITPTEPISLVLQKNAQIIWTQVRTWAWDAAQAKERWWYFEYYEYPDGAVITPFGNNAHSAGLSGGDLTERDVYSLTSTRLYFGTFAGTNVDDNFSFRRIYNLQKEQQGPSLWAYAEAWELEGITAGG